MGLVKQTAVPTAESGKPKPRPKYDHLLKALEHEDADARRQAAREIVRFPEAARALASRLDCEEDAAVREVILNALVRLNDPSAFCGLVDCLRSENAALRNEAIEAFKQLGAGVDLVLHSLLADANPDIRIFAINILDSQRHSDAESWLIQVIERDCHVNVCAAAVDLLCEFGTVASTDALVRLKARFASEPYIQFASELALKRIREV